MLTLVVGFRNREIERVRRCLDSLAGQTFKEFTLIFVDYGSPTPVATKAKEMVERYAFARYVYSDTRGWPWNRSRALNIGVRRAGSDYVATTDIDMIFDPNFLAMAMERARPGGVVYCQPTYLPKDFNRWEEIPSSAAEFKKSIQNRHGGFMCLPTRVVHRIRGFDEYYRYWGVEDRDLAHRLTTEGLEPVWLPEQAVMFHQWHPELNYASPDFMPNGAWQRMSIHFEKQKSIVVRNREDWGAIHQTSQRQAWRFVDPESLKLVNNDQLVMVDLQPDDQVSVSDLLHRLRQAPSGHALAVEHANYPGHTSWLDAFIRIANRVVRKTGRPPCVDYRGNLLHAFISDCLFDYEEAVADYCLNIPVSDGLTLLVRA